MRLFLAITGLLATQAALAQLPSPALPSAPTPHNAEEIDEVAKSWGELDIKPPAFPKASGLVSFRVSSASDNNFFIDVDTLSIGVDGVVRYVLVVRSSGGAENVSFEGIRCATREQKYYAFGQRNGTWSEARNTQWRAIEAKDINRHHVVLSVDFFCTDGFTPPRAVRDIVQRIRYSRR